MISKTRGSLEMIWTTGFKLRPPMVSKKAEYFMGFLCAACDATLFFDGERGLPKGEIDLCEKDARASYRTMAWGKGGPSPT